MAHQRRRPPEPQEESITRLMEWVYRYKVQLGSAVVVGLLLMVSYQSGQMGARTGEASEVQVATRVSQVCPNGVTATGADKNNDGVISLDTYKQFLTTPVLSEMEQVSKLLGAPLCENTQEIRAGEPTRLLVYKLEWTRNTILVVAAERQGEKEVYVSNGVILVP